MDAGALYVAPHGDAAPHGPEYLFPEGNVDWIIESVSRIGGVRNGHLDGLINETA